NTSYTIEFFSSPTCDSGGFAQGKTFISDTTALTDGNGNTPTRFAISAGQNITATASAAGENTSRFSDCFAEGPARIDLSATQLNFNGFVGGTKPPDQSVILKNTGGVTLHWRAEAATVNGGNWLSVSNIVTPAVAPNDSTPIFISVDISNLVSDIYTGTIIVSSADANNSPQTINVTLTLGCSANSNKPGLGNSPNAASCSDVLSLSNVAPAGGSKVWEQSLKEGGLKATVTYLLASKPNAKLGLTVEDQDGNLIGASGFVDKARPNPTPSPNPSEDFVIPGKPDGCGGKQGCK
ncbi:MAG: hypothetical protein DMF74_27750, partial [Acidobacteria bacterium]